MKTYQPKQHEVKRNWQLIDAKNKILGRLATQIAISLMGKNKRDYSPHMDNGNNVVVVNAKVIKQFDYNRQVNYRIWEYEVART